MASMMSRVLRSISASQEQRERGEVVLLLFGWILFVCDPVTELTSQPPKNYKLAFLDLMGVRGERGGTETHLVIHRKVLKKWSMFHGPTMAEGLT